MTLGDRKRQGEKVIRWLWTGLTGSAEEVRDLGVEAAQDVERQVAERRERRMLNEDHRVEPAPPPAGRPERRR